MAVFKGMGQSMKHSCLSKVIERVPTWNKAGIRMKPKKVERLCGRPASSGSGLCWQHFRLMMRGQASIESTEAQHGA